MNLIVKKGKNIIFQRERAGSDELREPMASAPDAWKQKHTLRNVVTKRLCLNCTEVISKN